MTETDEPKEKSRRDYVVEAAIFGITQLSYPHVQPAKTNSAGEPKLQIIHLEGSRHKTAIDKLHTAITHLLGKTRPFSTLGAPVLNEVCTDLTRQFTDAFDAVRDAHATEHGLTPKSVNAMISEFTAALAKEHSPQVQRLRQVASLYHDVYAPIIIAYPGPTPGAATNAQRLSEINSLPNNDEARMRVAAMRDHLAKGRDFALWREQFPSQMQLLDDIAAALLRGIKREAPDLTNLPGEYALTLLHATQELIFEKRPVAEVEERYYQTEHTVQERLDELMSEHPRRSVFGGTVEVAGALKGDQALFRN